MKRFTLLFVALMSLSMLRANVITGTCGDNLAWSYDTDSRALVISGSGDMLDYGSYDSPWSTISGSILSISLPEGLTSIGDRAFYDCESVTSITIPEGVTSIGESAFSGCSFPSIVIPNSVVNIEQYAFGWCRELSLVVLPSSLTYIPYGLFVDGYNLKQITIPASVTEIGSNAFPYCEDVFIESSTPAAITSSTFKSDVVLHVPCNSVSNYLAAPIWQFLNIMGILDYDFTLHAEEGGTARITNSVCAANTVVIEATADAGYRFKSWSDGNTDNPRAIVLTADKSVTAQFERSTTYFMVNISGFGYMEIRDLDQSYYGPNWSGQVLEGTEIRFEAITDCGIFVGWSDGSEYSYRNIQITCDTTITANYTGIETYQVSITAGEHGQLSNEFVGTMSSCANRFDTRAIADEGYHFVEWSDGYEASWRNFEIISNLSVYAIFAKGEEGGKLGETLYWAYEADKKQITVSGNGAMTEHGYSYVGYFEESSFSGIEKIVVEEGATNISRSMFKSLRQLQSAELAASLVRIEESAFEDCRSLTSITFSTPSALDYIGDWAFYNCHELASVIIPEGVTTIGKAAFYGCSYLQELSLPASVRSISDNAFALCSRLQKISVDAVVPPTIAEKTFFEVDLKTPVYVPETSTDAYLAAPYWGRMNIIGVHTDVANTSASVAPTKQIINGQLLILREGKMYDVQGLEVK